VRRLLLIRHAKSSWKFPDLHDHDRPLNSRGRRNTELMSKRLRERGENLDVIISSTASRALDFAKAIRSALDIKLIANIELYSFSCSDLLRALSCIDNQYQRVAIVAHNPAITQVASSLTGIEIVNIPSSGIIALDCDIVSWGELAQKHYRMDYFDYPKRSLSIS